MLDRAEEYVRMSEAEGGHWWYLSLHGLVLRALRREACGLEARVVDAGCGTGGLLGRLRDHGYSRLQGFDLSPQAVDLSRRRGLSVAVGDIRQLAEKAGDNAADVVISNDTLYFFSPLEQAAVVAQFWRCLTPGGLLIMNLPALGAFRGRHDLQVGIRRRFSRADVARLLPPGWFEPVQVLYWPFLLSPIIWLVRSGQRLRLCWRPDERKGHDLQPLPRAVNRGCAWLVAAENALLPWKPWGSSIFVVARRRGGAAG